MVWLVRVCLKRKNKMGISDVFYNEFNRWRDSKEGGKEKIKGIKEAVNKSLTKFLFVWDDMISTKAYNFQESLFFLAQTSEELTDIAVEVDGILDKAFVSELRNISIELKKMSKFPQTGNCRERLEESKKSLFTRVNSLIVALKK